MVAKDDLLSDFKFGFWEKHSTIEHMHRVIQTIL